MLDFSELFRARRVDAIFTGGANIARLGFAASSYNVLYPHKALCERLGCSSTRHYVYRRCYPSNILPFALLPSTHAMLDDATCEMARTLEEVTIGDGFKTGAYAILCLPADKRLPTYKIESRRVMECVVREAD